MTQDVISLADYMPNHLAGVRARVARMTVILNAIDSGELLAAFPDCPLAQQAHSTAIDLLTALELELVALSGDLARM